MIGLAFAITNNLLNNNYIAEDVSPTDVLRLIESVLDKEPQLRKTIIHMRNPHPPPATLCNHDKAVMVTDDGSEVSCLNCLRMYKLDGLYPAARAQRERWAVRRKEESDVEDTDEG